MSAAAGFECRSCLGGFVRPAVPDSGFSINGEDYEGVQSFCYLGDMVSASGGVDLAVSSRIRCGWKKFHDLAPFLTSRAPLRMKAQVYAACVRSAMTYASETWAVKADHLARMQRAEKAMVRWMCGARLSDGVRSEELRRRMGLEDIVDVMRRTRLRWFGHVQRKEEDEWTKRSLHFRVEGKRPVGRPKRTWCQVLNEDMKALRLVPGMTADRQAWRCAIRRRPSDPVRRDQRTLNGE